MSGVKKQIRFCPCCNKCVDATAVLVNGALAFCPICGHDLDLPHPNKSTKFAPPPYPNKEEILRGLDQIIEKYGGDALSDAIRGPLTATESVLRKEVVVEKHTDGTALRGLVDDVRDNICRHAPYCKWCEGVDE